MFATKVSPSFPVILAKIARFEMCTLTVAFIEKMDSDGFGEGSKSAIMGAGPAGEYRLGFERVPGLAAEWEGGGSLACSSRLGARQISGGQCHGHGE